MQNEAIVLFDPISSGEAFKTVAKEMGFKVIAVFTKMAEVIHAVYHAKQEILFLDCDEVINSSDEKEILRKLKESKYLIRGAIAATEMGVELADRVAHALGLWCNPIELSEARRHKGRMREILKQSGLSCPDFRSCFSEEEVISF